MQMEVIPKRRSEIISLADQYKEQIENRKDGVRIGTKQFQCTCCICGNHFIRNRKACYFCEAEFCQRINKSYRDEQYRKSEKGQATRRKNRKSPITIETRKRYEQTEKFREIKSFRAKRYREENQKVRELDKARKLRYYYRKYSAMRYVTINGADAISFEDWQKLYSADTCYYCGKHIEGRDKTVDHKIPISRGGTNARENLVMCCQSCNSHKNNRTESEYYEWRKNHNERFIKNARS